MQEIEVKAELKDPAAIVSILEAKGCVFGPPVTQSDTVFVLNPGSSVDEYLKNDLFIRVRVREDGKTIFTAKYNPSRRHFGDEAVREHEVEVASAEAVQGIIGLLGYTEAVRIVKDRRTGELDGFEICIDELEGGGSFIEVERCVALDADQEPVKAAIHALLDELGITEEDKRAKRYDVQMLDRKYGTAS